MKVKFVLPVLLIIMMGFTQQAPYKVNDTIQNFSLTNARDNSTVSLSDFTKSKVVVIVFSSPSCAFSKIYEDRLVSLAKDFKEKEVNFIFINPNNPSSSPDDNAASMAKRAADKDYPFPFLIDNNQKIANQLGATKTPEAFVLKNVNGSFVLKYKGAIDDNPQLATDVTAQFLKDAIQSVLTNSPVKITERKATGCMIKK